MSDFHFIERMDLKILTTTFNVVLMAENSYSGILLWLAAGLLVGAAAYLMFMQMQGPPAAGNTTNVSVGPGANVTHVAVVGITIINPPDCPDCRSLAEVLPQIVNATDAFNLTIGYVANISASEGAAMISEYRVTKLPVMVLTGNFTSGFVSWWTNGPGTQESDGALVLRDIYPPYYENGSTVGLVRGVAIGAPGCPKCINASDYIRSLEDPRIDMRFSNATVLDGSDSAARTLIAEYNITKLPTLLLSDDANAYPFFSQYVLPFGEIRDGWFILRNTTPPYLDLQTGLVRGLVDTVLVVNSSCKDCFNVSDFSAYVTSTSGITVDNTTTYEADSTAGKTLIAKYNLTALPALLYSPEISAYGGFADLWLQRNSTIESDGWYVFRGYGLLRVTYQNITG